MAYKYLKSEMYKGNKLNFYRDSYGDVVVLTQKGGSIAEARTKEKAFELAKKKIDESKKRNKKREMKRLKSEKYKGNKLNFYRDSYGDVVVFTPKGSSLTEAKTKEKAFKEAKKKIDKS